MSNFVIQHKLPTSEQMREAVKRRFDAGLPLGANHVGRPVRKHVSDKMCGGKETPCLPGKGGTCVACSDDD